MNKRDRVHLQEGMERVGSRTFDETMANAAYVQGLILVAILQKVGPVELGDGWFERAESAVALTDPIDGKQFGDGIRAYSVPREEAGLPAGRRWWCSRPSTRRRPMCSSPSPPARCLPGAASHRGSRLDPRADCDGTVPARRNRHYPKET